MERKHFARDLFLKTLTNMGIKYEIDDGQIIWFDYQGMGFDAEEDKNGRYVTLEYIDLKSFGNIGDVIRMRRIINKVSKKSNVVITSSIKSTHYSRNILFVKEIPDIENYLRTELQMLICAYEMVNIELQNELGKEKMNTDKRVINHDNPTQTKELFIKNITEMDCKYEVWKNKDSDLESIVFEYQNEKYRATFFDYKKEVLIENHFNIYGVDLSDLSKVGHLRELINNVNQEYDVTAVYTIDNESHKMYANISRTIPFMEEMPQLISYLDSVLDQLSDAEFDIVSEMDEAEEIEKMGDLHQEPN